MVDKLEQQLQNLSADFNHPGKAYTLLSSIAGKGFLPEVEQQIAALKQRVPHVIFSVQLLQDYLTRKVPLYQNDSNFGVACRSRYGDENGVISRTSIEKHAHTPKLPDFI